MPQFIQINVVNAAIFPVQQRYRRYFPSSTPLTPLFSVSLPLKPHFLQFNTVKAAVFPVQHCQRRFFRFTAVNAAIFPAQAR